MTDWYLRLSERRPRQRVQKKSRLVKDQAALLPSTDTQRRPPEGRNGPRKAILPHFHGKVKREFTFFGLSTAAEKPQRGPRSGPGGPRRGARKTRPRAGAKPPGGHALPRRGTGGGEKKARRRERSRASRAQKPPPEENDTHRGPNAPAPREGKGGEAARGAGAGGPGPEAATAGPKRPPRPQNTAPPRKDSGRERPRPKKRLPGPRGARSRTRPGPQTGATGGPQGRPGGGERSEGENAGPPPRQRGRSRRAADGDSRPAAGAATGGNPGGLRKKPPQTAAAGGKIPLVGLGKAAILRPPSRRQGHGSAEGTVPARRLRASSSKCVRISCRADALCAAQIATAICLP